MKSIVTKRIPEAPLVNAGDLKSGETILVEVRGVVTTAQVWGKKILGDGRVSFTVTVDGSRTTREWIVPMDEKVNLFTLEMAKAVIA